MSRQRMDILMRATLSAAIAASGAFTTISAATGKSAEGNIAVSVASGALQRMEKTEQPTSPEAGETIRHESPLLATLPNGETVQLPQAFKAEILQTVGAEISGDINVILPNAAEWKALFPELNPTDAVLLSTAPNTLRVKHDPASETGVIGLYYDSNFGQTDENLVTGRVMTDEEWRGDYVLDQPLNASHIGELRYWNVIPAPVNPNHNDDTQVFLTFRIAPALAGDPSEQKGLSQYLEVDPLTSQDFEIITQYDDTDPFSNRATWQIQADSSVTLRNFDLPPIGVESVHNATLQLADGEHTIHAFPGAVAYVYEETDQSDDPALASQIRVAGSDGIIKITTNRLPIEGIPEVPPGTRNIEFSRLPTTPVVIQWRLDRDQQPEFFNPLVGQQYEIFTNNDTLAEQNPTVGWSINSHLFFEPENPWDALQDGEYLISNVQITNGEYQLQFPVGTNLKLSQYVNGEWVENEFTGDGSGIAWFVVEAETGIAVLTIQFEKDAGISDETHLYLPTVMADTQG